MRVTKRVLVSLALAVLALVVPILLATPTSAYAVAPKDMQDMAKNTPTVGNHVIVFSYSRHELRIYKITKKKVYNKKTRKYTWQKQYTLHGAYKACGSSKQNQIGRYKLNYNKLAWKNGSAQGPSGLVKYPGLVKYHYFYVHGYDKNGTLGVNQSNAIHSYLYRGTYNKNRTSYLLTDARLQPSGNPAGRHSSGGCTRVPKNVAKYIYNLPRGTGYAIMR